ncbi:hypothetical protein CC2G_002188 [Coprinopsis cinerea AmutBmut pab1-1]|nr:hypothetical protein CC2G_002188 [Coprinopsis cinerea AmutBmut pab1-1]
MPNESRDDAGTGPSRPPAGGPSSSAVFTFMPSQVAYLREAMEEYRELNGAGIKAKFATNVADTLIREIHELSGVKPSDRRKALLEQAVTQWFEDNGRVDIRKPKRVWAFRWNARRVFGSIHSGIVKFVAQLLLNNKPIPNLRKLYDEEEAFLAREGIDNNDMLGEEEQEEYVMGSLGESGEEDGDVEDEGIEETPKRKKPGKRERKKGRGGGTNMPTYFVTYQDAITLFWTVLTPKEIEKYEHICMEWREVGPPRSEQRKAASRHLHTRCYDFAEAALRDFGAVVYFWIGFEDAQLVRRSYDLECKLGVAGVSDFQPTCRAIMEESGLGLAWGQHVDKVLNSLYGTTGQETTDPKPRRRHGKPIIEMDVDEDGYPILPSLDARPSGKQHQLWITELLRSYFARHWALATTGKVLPPTTCTTASVQWTGIRERWDDCIHEHMLPKTLRLSFLEPSDASLPMKEAIYKVLYDRQEDPDVEKTFEFKAIPVKVKGQWTVKAVAERIRAPLRSQSPAPSGPRTPAATRSKARSKGKKAAKTRTQGQLGGRGASTRPESPSTATSSTATSSESETQAIPPRRSTVPSTATSTATSTPASLSSSTDTSTEKSTETSSEKSQSTPSTRTPIEETSTSSERSSTSDDDSPAPRQFYFPSRKDLEREEELPPPASSSSSESAAPLYKRLRLEVPPVDEAALKTPRMTRAERARAEAQQRTSTRSASAAVNQVASGLRSSSRRGRGRGRGKRGSKR